MFQYKVIQYDVSRGRIPTIETVKRHMDFLRPYGVNGILFYMESVVQTDTFPAVACGKTPITKDYLRELNKQCTRRGVHLIPLFQTLAHQDNLLKLDAFQHLGEFPPPQNQSLPNNFLPWSAEVREKVARWLGELIPLFDSPFVHLGCDEVFNLGRGRSHDRVAKQGMENLLADYFSFLNDFVRGAGKRMMIYADLCVDFPGLLALLPKDIILVNWNYGLPNEAYEADNHHFAAHPKLSRCGHTVWGSGNNMAEYGGIPFYRLEKNTETWKGLCRRHGAEGFIISDWGYEYTFVLSILGDQYILMKLEDEALTLERFLASFSRTILGEKNRSFIKAMTLILRAQGNPRYFDRRLTHLGPHFGSLMMEDPAASGFMGRHFGCLTERGLDRFLADMREARDLLAGIRRSRLPHPDLWEDCRMIGERALMIALRAKLWHEYAWDTSYPGPLADRDQRRKPLLKEYMGLSAANLQWSRKRWRADNMESELDMAMSALENARSAIPRLFPYSPMDQRVNGL